MSKTMGSTATVVTGWRVTVPDDDGEPREIYRGASRAEARVARNANGSPSARFERVDVNVSPFENR